MTKDIYTKLTEFKKQIDSAMRTNYASFAHDDFIRFCEVYKEHYGVALTASEKSCSACKLRALKRIGADYYTYQKWYNARFGNSKDSNPVEEIAAE